MLGLIYIGEEMPGDKCGDQNSAQDDESTALYSPRSVILILSPFTFSIVPSYKYDCDVILVCFPKQFCR